MTPSFRRRHVLFALVLCLATGCVKKTAQGPAAVFTMEWWMGALTILGGLVAIAVGAFLFRKNWWRGAIFCLLGVGAIVVAPAMFLDEVRVDDDHFEARYGFWWSPSRHNIRFDDLREIQVLAKTQMTRRGQRVTYELNCVRKSGGAERVPLGTVMDEAGPEIVARAQAKGVPIRDLTGQAK